MGWLVAEAEAGRPAGDFLPLFFLQRGRVNEATAAWRRWAGRRAWGSGGAWGTGAPWACASGEPGGWAARTLGSRCGWRTACRSGSLAPEAQHTSPAWLATLRALTILLRRTAIARSGPLGKLGTMVTSPSCDGHVCRWEARQEALVAAGQPRSRVSELVAAALDAAHRGLPLPLRNVAVPGDAAAPLGESPAAAFQVRWGIPVWSITRSVTALCCLRGLAVLQQPQQSTCCVPWLVRTAVGKLGGPAVATSQHARACSPPCTAFQWALIW